MTNYDPLSYSMVKELPFPSVPNSECKGDMIKLWLQEPTNLKSIESSNLDIIKTVFDVYQSLPMRVVASKDGSFGAFEESDLIRDRIGDACSYSLCTKDLLPVNYDRFHFAPALILGPPKNSLGANGSLHTERAEERLNLWFKENEPNQKPTFDDLIRYLKNPGNYAIDIGVQERGTPLMESEMATLNGDENEFLVDGGKGVPGSTNSKLTVLGIYLKEPLEPLGIQYAIEMKYYYKNKHNLDLPFIIFDDGGGPIELTEEQVKEVLKIKLGEWSAQEPKTIQSYFDLYESWAGLSNHRIDYLRSLRWTT